MCLDKELRKLLLARKTAVVLKRKKGGGDLKTNKKRHNVRANSDFIRKLRVLQSASSTLISLRLENDVRLHLCFESGFYFLKIMIK